MDSTDFGKGKLVSIKNGKVVRTVSIDHIKSEYICSGLSAKDIADEYGFPVREIENLIESNKLDELRAAHIKQGLNKLQNIQIAQAEKLMDMETQFKKMRIMQIERMLGDYVAYFNMHKHFYKLHPNTREILRDTDGIPMQIRLPNVGKELNDLKESVSLSEGLKNILGQIDSIINKPKDIPLGNKKESDIIDVEGLFQQKPKED